MEVDSTRLFRDIQIVEVHETSRGGALHELAKAAGADQEEDWVGRLLSAVEEREATAQTIVANGFALPHAMIESPFDCRVVLGRSRAGVEYGVPESGRVHLLVLLIVSDRHAELHLKLLALLAELLGSEEFRNELIAATDVHAISQLLRTKSGAAISLRMPRRTIVPELSSILARQAIELCEVVGGQALLIAVDNVESIPWQPLESWEGRLLLVLSEKNEDFLVAHSNTHLFEVPHTTLTRVDRANLGLLLAASADLVTSDSNVVCITGPGGPDLDSLTVMKPAVEFQAVFGHQATRRSASIRPAVILRVLSLAIELAAEGRESHRVGAMFVIGDSRNVMRHARQLVLNPFHGYSHELRNILDPSLTETIKEFAFLDGAFVVQPDGIVLSAGTYLTASASSFSIPQGLGTRHQAAAAITANTHAMAITVSQSTGSITVFRSGQILLTLEHATPTPTRN